MHCDDAFPFATGLRRRFLIGFFGLTALSPVPLHAQDLSTRVVEQWHAALLDVMRQARSLSVQGRYDQLKPVMDVCFDLPTMTRIAIGPLWPSIVPDQQAALTQAFSEWSIATYASRFNGFSGESFITSGETELRNGDRMVRTALNRPSNNPVQLNYLLRRTGNAWRVVDVYLAGSISELASRRADFSGLLTEGGPARLVAELRRRSTILLQG